MVCIVGYMESKIEAGTIRGITCPVQGCANEYHRNTLMKYVNEDFQGRLLEIETDLIDQDLVLVGNEKFLRCTKDKWGAIIDPSEFRNKCIICEVCKSKYCPSCNYEHDP